MPGNIPGTYFLKQLPLFEKQGRKPNEIKIIVAIYRFVAINASAFRTGPWPDKLAARTFQSSQETF